jgi:beta-ketodecanoyl-[acyl-carrier-protein] synthase
MKNVVISGTGLYRPPHVITNAELVQAFNAYADLQNEKNARRASPPARCRPMVHSSVEFIEKASGIQQRYVIDKAGVLDPTRMYPRFAAAARRPAEPDGRDRRRRRRARRWPPPARPGPIDAVLCAAANMQRAYPAMACEIQQALGAAATAST